MALALCLLTASACSDGTKHEPVTAEPIGHPGMASPNAQSIALSPSAGHVYVANTAADTLDIIDADSREIIQRVATGVDPVSVAVRPDGLEVWVSNHVSDSVSVIDVDPESATHYQVVATVQSWDRDKLITDFDEPVGIAFASNEKAYVALSSRNNIAVVDVATRTVTKQLKVRSQEPRALRVRNGKLFVIPFESGNQTQLSGCFGFNGEMTELCTFDIVGALRVNGIDSILSRGFVADIVRNPDTPDRDLFVYDTQDDSLLQEVDTLGTLLYGLAIGSNGQVYVALTEARNTANGKMGTLGHDLKDIENRMFDDQIATLDCSGESCLAPGLFDLHPALPAQPAEGMALATPFGIEISGDDGILVGVAASSSRLFTMDADTGAVLGRVSVGGIPRALALESDAAGAPTRAWVHNVVESSVSLVDVSNPASPTQVHKVMLDDPTHPDVKAGRIAFNNAAASSSGTFSCGSCHPDAHTDQLLWNLGARCETEGCDQTQARSTMPVRGLRDTLPLHWDGVPGDPFGGINAIVNESGIDVPPNCTDEHSCFRDLVNGAQSGTMCDQPDCPEGPSGLKGLLTEAERDAMAIFIRSVPYPPTRSRRFDDQLSSQAWDGFRKFLIGVSDDKPGCSRAGVCHTLPFWAGTNTPRQGMDAPTFRGIPDRHLLLPNGRAGMWQLHELRTTVNEVEWDPADGPDELFSWGVTFGSEVIPLANRITSGTGPFDYFQLFDEGSMGFSGMFGRQATLDATTLADGASADTIAMIEQLEVADANTVIDLRAEGVWLANDEPVSMLFADGLYHPIDDTGMTLPGLTRETLIEDAQDGKLLLTLTGRMGAAVDVDHPQPALWLPALEPENILSLQKLPEIAENEPTPSISLFGRHVVEGARVLIDGNVVDATVSCEGAGALPNCDDERITLELAEKPAVGDHTFQVTTPRGYVSNEVMLIVK